MLADKGLLEILPQQGSLIAVPSVRSVAEDGADAGLSGEKEAAAAEEKPVRTPSDDLLLAAEAAGMVHTKKVSDRRGGWRKQRLH